MYQNNRSLLSTALNLSNMMIAKGFPVSPLGYTVPIAFTI